LRLVVTAVAVPHICVHIVVVPAARMQATQQVQIVSGWQVVHSGQQLVLTQV
jgi:hypothetical protein